MSITYRGSAYEQSWETYFYAIVARLLRIDTQRLRQSSTATTRRPTSDTSAHL